MLRISQGGETLGTLSATDPKLDVPIGIPMPGSGVDSDLPLVGHSEMPNVIDIGVLRLNIGDVQKSVNGDKVHAVARMLDVTLLPGEPLGLQTSLAKISFGEQAAHADAPAGGVHCGAPASTATPTAAEPVDDRSSQGPTLAVTSGAYHTVPLFWTGTSLLLLGAVLLAAVPRRN